MQSTMAGCREVSVQSACSSYLCCWAPAWWWATVSTLRKPLRIFIALHSKLCPV